MSSASMFENEIIIVIIPAYHVEAQIARVIQKIPGWVSHIIVIDDASTDQTYNRVAELDDPRITLVHHEKNKGVGGAMLTGFKYAIDLDASIIVKVDGDDQAPLEYLPDLVMPILQGKANFVKGNRFVFTKSLDQMPLIRRIGNLALSFFVKFTSGYWNLFDPTNGFVAMDGHTLRYLDQTYLHNRFFFETSLLVELNIIRAVVLDIPVPARYQDETSSLSILNTLIIFPLLLFKRCLRRLWLEYFVFDFSIGSLFLISGIFLNLFGGIWGGVAWRKSIISNIPATTGTVMIAAMPIIIGVQLLIQFIVVDIQNLPKENIIKEKMYHKINTIKSQGPHI